ncbi:hypothetical protein [Acinetobacter sp. V115_6]|uniref:hypothetical protein n=1 Tax=Acinetobacter sp. V115_6 TaxID=3072987 RepID=UPI00287F2F71|nr:hypothetical protein [Acinetobacter sp. V115_6]MDS7927632.1 hypothetical protein [Acinetobacter sp. V115_6]
MNMFVTKPELLCPRSKLLQDLSKHPELLAGAVEYAFQSGDINSKEYRHWKNKIAENERKHTAALLATIKA